MQSVGLGGWDGRDAHAGAAFKQNWRGHKAVAAAGHVPQVHKCDWDVEQAGECQYQAVEEWHSVDARCAARVDENGPLIAHKGGRGSDKQNPPHNCI